MDLAKSNEIGHKPIRFFYVPVLDGIFMKCKTIRRAAMVKCTLRCVLHWYTVKGSYTCFYIMW